MTRHKKWFAGLKWAEDEVKIHGIDVFENHIMRDRYLDSDQFDRGAQDYLFHYKRRLAQ